MKSERCGKLALHVDGDDRRLAKRIALLVVGDDVVLQLGKNVVKRWRCRRRAKVPIAPRGRATIDVVGNGTAAHRGLPAQDDPERGIRIAARNQLITQVRRGVRVDTGGSEIARGEWSDERNDEQKRTIESHGQ